VALLTCTERPVRPTGRVLTTPVVLLLAILLAAVPTTAMAQTDEDDGGGAVWQDGRLVLEEITIRGELRTPQALFMMLKATPNLSNVLLERSFLEDVVRPVYPGAFADETSLGSGREVIVLPAWARYGSVAVFGGLSAYRYSQNDEEQGLVFGVIAGLDLIGNLVLDLVDN